RSPLLAGLTGLALTSSGGTDRDARELARSPHAARLAYLELSDNPLGDAGPRALGRSPHLRGLGVLRLARLRAASRRRRALSGPPLLANLVVLDLSENTFGDSGGHDPTVPLALVSSPYLGNVRYLDLSVDSIWRRYSDEVRVELLARFGDAL